jgi:hypothetical protein
MPLLVAGPMMLMVALAWLAWVSGVFATAPASLGRAALKRTIFGALGLLALPPPRPPTIRRHAGREAMTALRPVAA